MGVAGVYPWCGEGEGRPLATDQYIGQQWAAAMATFQQHRLGAERQHQSLRLKMGIHEGSCLAVTLNGQQDYFGQTVNIASRVQGLAASRSIVVTEQVVENAHARALLETSGLKPEPRRVALSGIADKVSVYEIS